MRASSPIRTSLLSVSDNISTAGWEITGKPSMKVGNLSTLSTETEAIIIDRTQISFLIQIPTRRVIFDYELARLSFPLVTAQPTSLTVAVPQRFFFLEMVSQFFQHFELSVNLFSSLLINYTIESCTRAYRIADIGFDQI